MIDSDTPRATIAGASPVKQSRTLSRRGSLYTTASVATHGATAEVTAWADGRVDIELRAPGDRYGARVLVATLYPSGVVAHTDPDRPTLYLNTAGASSGAANVETDA